MSRKIFNKNLYDDYNTSKDIDEKKVLYMRNRDNIMQLRVVIGIFICFIAFIGFVVYKNHELNNRSDNTVVNIFETTETTTDNTDNVADETHENQIVSGSAVQTVSEKNNQYENAIFCWGDSFSENSDVSTNFYGYFIYENLVSINAKNISGVYSAGSSAETLRLLAAKTGTYPMVTNAFTIPADTTPVEVTLKSSYDSSDIVLDKFINSGLNPCVIQGVQGEITYDGEKTTFKRSQAGEQVNVPGGSQVFTNIMNNMSDYISVFFFGNIPEYSLEKTIKLYKDIVGDSNRYVIVGAINGTENDLSDYEKALDEAFGDHYINIREYLCSKAFDSYDITINSSDLEQLKNNTVPDSFKLQNKRLNDKTAKIVGDVVFNRLLELNIVS